MSRFYVLLLLLPFLLVRKNATYHAELEHRNHSEVFEYLSNVSAFRTLNPTITDITYWKRLNETSFYVEYTECLSQIPVLRNYARGYYTIQKDAHGSHELISRHSTCFFTDFFCLPTDSRLQISKLSHHSVGYQEAISYSCPWALTSFCFNEVTFQRKQIISNLRRIFAAGNKSQRKIN